MFQGWLICIFSYNRGTFLQNLLDSIQEFYPEIRVAIFDDGSDDEQTLALLEAQRETKRYVYSSSQDKGDSKHGGLYGLMNVALEYAGKHGYRYAYFVQEDMQFLWRDEDLEDKVKMLFEREECMMCNFNFLQKILTKGIKHRLPKVARKIYSFKGYGVADTGIIDLEKANRAALNFHLSSEGGNGNYWYDKGYRLYWQPSSHLAWIPWPTTVRYKRSRKRGVHRVEPISEQQIQTLNEKDSYTFLEDHTHAKTLWLKPYWYAANPGTINLIKVYFKYFFGNVFQNELVEDKDRLLIPLQPFGIGDVIYQQTLVHALAADKYKILWPVEVHFVEGLNRAYPRVKFIDKAKVPVDYNNKKDIKLENLRIVPLRWADVLLGMVPDDCMKAKYKLYNLDWRIWKRQALWARDRSKEDELFNKLGLSIGDKYIFLNQTFRSNFQDHADISIDSTFKIVEMKVYPGFSIFDWAKVIEQATEIHTVSTALFYILEMLELKQPIHLYHRPNDPKFEHVKFMFTKPYILH